jgi:signal transduction histidine kinase
VTVNLDLAPLPPVYGAEHLLQDVFRRVITNAAEAMPDGGEIRVRTQSDGSVVSVVVQDDGPGLTPEVQRRAFDPFFTTKGSHTRGLGLSTSFGIVQRHEGRIEIHPGPDQGTEVVVTLPAQSRGRRVVPFDAAGAVSGEERAGTDG